MTSTARDAQELWERAMQLVLEHGEEYPPAPAAIESNSVNLGMTKETLWRRARRANEILRAASLLLWPGTGPETPKALKFIAESRERSGLESICSALQSAPAT